MNVIGQGWRCWRCGAHGDALTFASYAVAGVPRPVDWHPVLEALERGSYADRVVHAVRPPEPERTPPPCAEVGALWRACCSALADADAIAWIESRGVDVGAVVARQLARALPARATVPAWARLNGATWPERGYRLLVPMFDRRGRLASLHARNVNRTIEPKGASPAGCATAGLVFANAAGVTMLRTCELAGELWILEGAPDFLSAAAAPDLPTPAPAVLGIISGSWKPEISQRVPDGARVVVAVHPDGAGQGYAARISDSLGNRVAFVPWDRDRRAAS